MYVTTAHGPGNPEMELAPPGVGSSGQKGTFLTIALVVFYVLLVF